MVAVPQNPVQLVRLSPSGPQLGNPPSQIGGGALIPGRSWVAQGRGSTRINVPNPPADVAGLEAVPVNFRAGYRYDVEVDAVFYGTSGGIEINLLASLDGGATYGAIVTTPPEISTGSLRAHVTNVTATYDHLKVQVATTNPSSSSCLYQPDLTALKITEYTS